MSLKTIERLKRLDKKIKATKNVIWIPPISLQEVKQTFDYLIPDLNNIIVNYLIGLPDWLYVGSKVKMTENTHLITEIEWVNEFKSVSVKFVCLSKGGTTVRIWSIENINREKHKIIGIVAAV